MTADRSRPGSARSVAVLGAGSWGTTFAKILADAAAAAGVERSIRLWGRRSEVVEQINTTPPQPPVPEGHRAAAQHHSVHGRRRVSWRARTWWSSPFPRSHCASQLREWKRLIAPDAVVVSLMKGLELGTDARMSEVIGEELGIPADRIAVVSGPNLAMEIAREEPTASVVACADAAAAGWIARSCTAPYFRPYTTADVVGVEIGGIVKNVIALAVGICEGKQMGDNTKASVITRGLAETSRLALALGGEARTMAGLAGLGDLVATCSSPLSRNHTAGRLLGQGLTLDEVAQKMTQTAEGIKSGQAVHELAGKLGVEMPITAAVVAVLAGKLSVDQLGPLLLSRELKPEGDY